MSDDRIGVAIYDEDHPDGSESRTVCNDCFHDELVGEGIATATINDSPAYGDRIPYPECAECGEVMRNEWFSVEKRPVTVEARGPYYDPTHVETLEGDFEVDEEYAEGGYYIIRGIEGELYPCRADIFNETYRDVGAE